MYVKKKDEKKGPKARKISNLLKKNISFINSDSTIASYTS